MPLTLTLTEQVLPTDKIDDAVQRLTDSMLKWHELTGNTVMTPNATATVHIVEKGRSYSGGVPFRGAWVEWKVPSFAFASRDAQKGFGQEATDILYELSGGMQPKAHIYFNVVHTVDGSWNLNGQAMTNEELGAVIATGAPTANARQSNFQTNTNENKKEQGMNHILLIHGAWGGAWEFQEIIDGLRKRGHQASAIDLPGHGQPSVPISEVTMDAYVQCVIEAAGAIEGPIVLVGHSLGGAVITQVAERAPRKIERLVYAAAILPRNGETPLGLMQSDEAGQLLPKLVFSEDESYVTVGPEAVASVLLHDVREPERLNAFLPHFAMKQATEPFQFAADVTVEAFGSVPKTYIRASLDKVLSLPLQDRMLTGWEIDQVFTLESGHFPLMSVPERLTAVISEAAGVAATRA